MPDEIILRFSVKDDGSPVIERVNKKIGETRKQSQALVPGLENARQSLTGFVGQNAALIGVLAGVGVALGKIIKDHIQYAEQVRTLSNLSGQSTEETSRFIQVLDDYKISADDALTATRALTRNGHAPSIETLAQLSDQYLAINDVEKQNAFVLTNLGRGGAQWVEVLKKGSKALLEQGSAIDKSLLLTQKMVDDARKAEIATDNWNDSITALKTQLSVSLLPALTGVVKQVNALNEADRRLAEEGLTIGTAKGKERHNELLKEVKAEQDAAEAAMLHTDAMEGEKDAAEESAEAFKERMKAMTESNQSMLSLIGDIQSAEESYHSKAVELNEERIRIEGEKADALAQGWWEGSEKIREYDQALADNSVAADENAKEHELATNRILFGLAQQKLMQDGILTDDEMNWLLEKGVAWGIFEQDVVAKAQAMQAEINNITASVANIPDKSFTITANFVNTYTDLQTSSPGYWNSEKHAMGGTFMIPSSYGNEGFSMGGRDTASGGEKLTITPKNQDVIDYKKLGRAVREALVRVGG